MSSTTETTKNFFDTMVETQKNLVKNWAETTGKVNESIINTADKASGTDYFTKWWDSQKAFFEKLKVSGTDNLTNTDSVEYFANWFNNVIKTNQEAYNKFMGGLQTNPAFNINGNFNNLSQMQSLYTSWSNAMQNSFSEMTKNFTNNNAQSTFSGMFNTADNYMRMFEFWMPMFRSIQDKTFTAETFRNTFNVEKYKEMMDKMFQFVPVANLYGNNMQQFQDFGKTWMDWTSQAYHNFKSGTAGMFPSNIPGLLDQTWNTYQEFSNSMSNVFAPAMKMMTPGTQKDQLIAAQHIANQVAAFNTKNAQMQYMIYTTGIKAMETFAEEVAEKIKNGATISDFISLYNHWLTTNDRVFIELFSSDEYSKIQADFSAIVLTLKKNIESQMEKMMAGIPVVPRSEMDELYTTINDLKKQVRNLEKQLNNSAPVAETAVKAAPVKKTATK